MKKKQSKRDKDFMDRLNYGFPTRLASVPAPCSATDLLREIELHMRVSEDSSSFDAELYSRVEAYLRHNPSSK